MTTQEEDQLLFNAKRAMNRPNDGAPGTDSKKRKAAIELIAGPPDGLQTDRLLKLAIAMAEARRA